MTRSISLFEARGICYGCERQGKDTINEPLESDKRAKEIYGAEYIDSRYIQMMRAKENNSYTRGKQRQAMEIREKVSKGHQIEFYNNFIIIDGKTYNGWNKEQIETLFLKINKLIENELEFEWEED